MYSVFIYTEYVHFFISISVGVREDAVSQNLQQQLDKSPECKLSV
mgnify:CR=1